MKTNGGNYMKNKKGEFEFINMGISGDKIVDIYARIPYCEFGY